MEKQNCVWQIDVDGELLELLIHNVVLQSVWARNGNKQLYECGAATVAMTATTTTKPYKCARQIHMPRRNSVASATRAPAFELLSFVYPA